MSEKKVIKHFLPVTPFTKFKPIQIPNVPIFAYSKNPNKNKKKIPDNVKKIIKQNNWIGYFD
jgi:hypothetical protein